MKLLGSIYSSPADLLAKARRDHDMLLSAVAAGDDVAVRDKLFDFSVTAYHIVDWVKAFDPNLEKAAYDLLESTPALKACRDIANSNKHYELDVDSGPYRRFPPVVNEIDYSIGPSVTYSISASGGDMPAAAAPPRRLKVILTTGTRSRAEDIASEAVAAWERFFANHKVGSEP